MDSLEIGDFVLTDSGYSKVYSFGHKDLNIKVNHLQVFATNMAPGHPLEISPEHLLYTFDSTTNAKSLIAAGDLRVGDHLVTKQGTPSKITSVHTVMRHGAYSPLTSAGNLLVDEVLASSYVSRGWLKKHISGDTLHAFQHGSVVPYRLFCTLFGCAEEIYDGVTGFSSWVHFWFRVEQWQLKLAKVFQVIFWLFIAIPAALLLLLGKVLDLPTNTLAAHVAIAGLGYWVICKYQLKEYYAETHATKKKKGKSEVQD